MLGIQIQTSKIDLKYSGTYHKLQKYTLITSDRPNFRFGRTSAELSDKP